MPSSVCTVSGFALMALALSGTVALDGAPDRLTRGASLGDGRGGSGAVRERTDCTGCFATSGVPTINPVTGLTITFTTTGSMNGTCEELDSICEEESPCKLFLELAVTNNTGERVYVTAPGANIIVEDTETLNALIKFGEEGDVECGDVENPVTIGTWSTTAFSINLECSGCDSY